MTQSRPKTIPRRDPQTGQFVSGDNYDDVEVVSFTAGFGVEAANLEGSTSFSGSGDTFEFSGVELVDYDDVVDRNETLHLLNAQHRLVVFSNSTQTEDGTVLAGVEVSASPSVSLPGKPITGPINDFGADNLVTGGAATDDSIDLVGRPLMAMAGSPFSDTATGIGGGGSQGDDEVEVGNVPAPIAEFHPRDELFGNGELTAWNIDDSGIHAQLMGQHIYGVVSE